MYLRSGEYPGARCLLAALAGVELQTRPGGYQTSGPGQTVAAFTPLLAATFGPAWADARLVIVVPGGTIPPHRDHVDPALRWRRRLLVLQTNPDAWVLHDGTWQQLAEDGIYEVDPGRVHAAVNWGSEPRVHLVVNTDLSAD